MATKPATADYLVEQLSGAGAIAVKKVFGEYGVYRGDVMFALICDDELYVKDTPGGRALLAAPELKPPYPGAKPCLWIRGDRCEDADWLADLVRVTVRELPAKVAAKKARPASASKSRAAANPKAAAKPQAAPKSKPKAAARSKAASKRAATPSVRRRAR